MSAVLIERTFESGKNHYRVNARGDWSVLLFGWFPTGPCPRYQWSPIPKDRVPRDVREAARV